MSSAGPATTATTTTTEPSPPTPPADPVLDPDLKQKLIASGDRDRLAHLLAERLEQCGWRDQVSALARDALAGVGCEHRHPTPPRTADALAGALRPAARAAVPDGVKAELLGELRAAILGLTAVVVAEAGPAGPVAGGGGGDAAQA